MGKISRKNSSNSISSTTSKSEKATNTTIAITKTRRTRKAVPHVARPQRSSIYRGVTRHRWTGRYEAHLWDKNCWNETQNKKGRQVYLGAYNDEEVAARAYDLAALKYWGQKTLLNFPLSTYDDQLKEMEGLSKEEFIGSLRRKSSGFSRGVSKYRGVARHHHNGRWEARIGRVFGNKYLYLGTYATQEEAATAYDIAAIEYRGPNAVTNFDLSRYIKWLRPNQTPPNPNTSSAAAAAEETSSSAALGLLLQSSKFKEMLEKTAAATTTTEDNPAESSDAPRRIFPDDIQTFFEDSGGFGDGDDGFFGELNSFVPPMFQCQLDS